MFNLECCRRTVELKPLHVMLKEARLNWVHPDFTEENFPAPVCLQKVVEADFVVATCTAEVSPAQVSAFFADPGLKVVGLYILLAFAKLVERADKLVALATVFNKQFVPYLDENGGPRNLYFEFNSYPWKPGFCFLAVKKNHYLFSNR